jgi:hypothetical protein
MRVDAHAFFSEILFDRTEESMWKQLASAASYPGVIGAHLRCSRSITGSASLRLPNSATSVDAAGRLR